MNYVLVGCGSSARGDTNAYSDVDTVCIWKNASPDFDALQKKYGQIMFYSAETIERMKAKGSLFLTHLDLDSVYITGNKAMLSTFKGFRPSHLDSAQSLHETFEFVSNIKWYPKSDLGRLWLFDVLYVAFRNIVYCKNAMTNIYVFGFLDALKACHLTDSEISWLLAIREGKYRYRGQALSSAEHEEVEDIEIMLPTLMNRLLALTAGGKTRWSPTFRTDYWGERLIERAVLNEELQDVDFMKKIQRHNYHRFVIRSHIRRIIARQLRTSKRLAPI